MAVHAYVLIQTEVGRAASVARSVSEVPGVVTAEDVTGPYDVIVRTEAENMDELGRMVVGRIQIIEGITRTVTCPVVNL
ncbi:MAG: Lrp/AsnC ligand binding domain-containing protein [Actinomycetota bacterium]|jgi:DNA-binding Lrp family transcriptional regulator|nr:Lrp/AsnC ligand binding domain-containing protein [Actinomycetota bacterium]